MPSGRKGPVASCLGGRASSLSSGRSGSTDCRSCSPGVSLDVELRSCWQHLDCGHAQSLTVLSLEWSGEAHPGVTGIGSPCSEAATPWHQKPPGATPGTPLPASASGHSLPASAPGRHTPTGTRGPAHRELLAHSREGGATAPRPRTMEVTGRRWICWPRERRLVLGEAGPGVGLPQALEREEMQRP